jgi:hypothetical protein
MYMEGEDGLDCKTLAAELSPKLASVFEGQFTPTQFGFL